jgi:hypothetical protein
VTAPQGADPDIEDVVYQLALAGASATLEVGGYALSLGGTGIVELLRASASLVDVLMGAGHTKSHEDVRGELPGVASGATLHAWVFGSFMAWLPVVVFAIEDEWVSIYTRTHAEAPGAPLVVLEGRDNEQPVRVARLLVLEQTRAFVARCVKIAETRVPGARDAHGYRERVGAGGG